MLVLVCRQHPSGWSALVAGRQTLVLAFNSYGCLLGASIYSLANVAQVLCAKELTKRSSSVQESSKKLVALSTRAARDSELKFPDIALESRSYNCRIHNYISAWTMYMYEHWQCSTTITSPAATAYSEPATM